MPAIKQISIQDPTGGAAINADIGALGSNVLYSDDTTRNIEEAFVGTNGENPGKKGLVPAPTIADMGKFLSASGFWRDPEGGVTSVNGKVGAVILKASDLSAIGTEEKGAVNGVAELDASGKVPSNQLPSYVDDVIECYFSGGSPYEEQIIVGYLDNGVFYTDAGHTDPITPVVGKIYKDSPSGDTYEWDTATSAYVSATPTAITGETGKIYVDLNTNKTYRWGGSAFIEISESLALGETSSTAYRGDRGKAAYDHSQDPNAISAALSEALYKISATAEGHVASGTPVTKSDITDLGIPEQDTQYEGIDISVNSVNSWYPGLATTFVINGDKLVITPGVKASLVVASTTVLSGIQAKSSTTP